MANVRYRQCMVSAKKLNEVYAFVVFLKKLKISNLFPTSSWSRKAMYLHPWQYKTYQNFKVCKHNMTLAVFFFFTSCRRFRIKQLSVEVSSIYTTKGAVFWSILKVQKLTCTLHKVFGLGSSSMLVTSLVVAVISMCLWNLISIHCS